MTEEQKITWIQYFQYKHALWLEEFNKNLSIGKCVDKLINDNLVITNLIGIFYRYKTLDSYITNQFTITFPNDSATDSLTIYLELNDVVLGSIVTSSENSPYIDMFVENINTSNEVFDTGYTAVREGNSVIVTSFNTNETCELPILQISNSSSELIPDYAIVTSTCVSLEDQLNEINCLTLKELCTLKEKILLLTKSCNCN